MQPVNAGPPEPFRRWNRLIAEHSMFKWAIIFLVISLIAGALGLTNASQFAKRVSMILFALFFLMFLALLLFAWLVLGAIDKSVLLALPLIA